MRTIVLIALLPLSSLAPLAARAQMPSMLDAPGTQVAAGGYHTCALTSLGRVKCWGRNTYGQLGTGASGSGGIEAVPVDVAGLADGVTAITAGESHTCALTAAGGVKCWGANLDGQLGNGSGSSTSSPVPVDVVGLGSGVVATTAGYSHTCALTAAGGVKCWGYNGFGQLGDGTTGIGRPLPGDVSGLASDVVAVTVGGYHTCALTTAGGVKCWGYNEGGELGDGTTENRHLPVDVSGLTSDVVAIATGDHHACALTSAAGVMCWGGNFDGQLGDGTTEDRLTPVAVSGLASGVAAIAAGGSQACALTTTGGVKCWGNNEYGQLGNGATSENNVTPVNVLDGNTFLPLGNVAGFTVGRFHTCAQTTTGAAKCWGYNDQGQLGNGNDGAGADSSFPVDVSRFADGVTAIEAGYAHMCAVTTAGGLTCWGRNEFGQLGNGTLDDSHTPVAVPLLASGVVASAPGFFHSCALTRYGGVECWGHNGQGELGDGTFDDRAEPEAVGLPDGAAAVAVGGYHSCALTAGGSVLCWGHNGYGQLGDGTTAPQSPTPVVVQGLSGTTMAITAGYNHACALNQAGAVRCWGRNDRSQLGDGSAVAFTNVPVAVTGLSSGVTAITADGWHTCALMTTGGVKCWGFNDHGQLGNGHSLPGTNSPVPVDVVDLASGVAAIAAGYRHTCALMTVGGVRCWGANNNGQLGDNTIQDSSVPVNVVDATNTPISDVAQIAVGGHHNCVLGTEGELRCWGRDEFGQLGNNGIAEQHTPVTIRAGQWVTFAPPQNLPVDAVIIPTATASGGGTVSFDTWTPSTCTFSGDELILTNSGLCGVTASQPGGSDGVGGTIAPAPQELRLIQVGAEVIFANGFDG